MGSLLQFTVIIVLLTVIWKDVESMCYLPPDGGPCRGYFIKWYFNKNTQQCETFVYGGCGGNPNRFDTKAECLAECVCMQPADPGECYAKLKRWFYNKHNNHCEMFNYGGCGGNANRYCCQSPRFHTEEMCLAACDLCLLPADSGPCYAYIKRFYYNSKKKKCKRFIYGGCKGNANNFKSKRKCKKACKHS